MEQVECTKKDSGQAGMTNKCAIYGRKKMGQVDIIQRDCFSRNNPDINGDGIAMTGKRG